MNHTKPINSNFALGPKMCKKYPEKVFMPHNVVKTSSTTMVSEIDG